MLAPATAPALEILVLRRDDDAPAVAWCDGGAPSDRSQVEPAEVVHDACQSPAGYSGLERSGGGTEARQSFVVAPYDRGVEAAEEVVGRVIGHVDDGRQLQVPRVSPRTIIYQPCS
eukprot:SAG22_NODE_6376_length_864_cov_2.210458_1_plen_116_part_00